MNKLGCTTRFLVAVFFVGYVFTMFPEVKSQAEEMVPVEVEGSSSSLVNLFHHLAAAPAGGGDLKPWRQCSTCQCCNRGGGGCVTVPCCFGMKCNIPGKTAGYCSLTPLACNCNDCKSTTL